MSASKISDDRDRLKREYISSATDYKSNRPNIKAKKDKKDKANSKSKKLNNDNDNNKENKTFKLSKVSKVFKRSKIKLIKSIALEKTLDSKKILKYQL